jgi:predicted short-subunit dehydrogenase-like oxidoreductase (DUF2520 family)
MTAKKPFTSYALLGSGRLARHLHFYLKSLNLPVRLWSRNGDPDHNSFDDVIAETRLQRTLAGVSHVLFAVKDEALPDLAKIALADSTRTVVHFSGAVRLDGVFSAHPLMTFRPELETLEWYPRIPFVLDEGVQLKDILPGLPNPSYNLSGAERPYYHALCSLAGNSTFLLWKQIGDEFERTLKLPRSLLSPFLHQVVANSSQFAETSFTGPVARGDWEVVKAHLDSLHRRPDLLQAYRQYLEIAEETGHQVPEDLR